MDYIIITMNDRHKRDVLHRNGRRTYPTLNAARQAAIKSLKTYFARTHERGEVGIRKWNTYYSDLDVYRQVGWVLDRYGEYYYESYGHGKGKVKLNENTGAPEKVSRKPAPFGL